MAVRHIFLWSIKDDHDSDAVLEKLASLEHAIPGIRRWSIGRHEGELPNSSSGKWEYALTCDVESFEALEAYQNHPVHLAVVSECAPSYADWAVLDYVLNSGEARTGEEDFREAPRIDGL
jgi:hypothetical protein